MIPRNSKLNQVSIFSFPCSCLLLPNGSMVIIFAVGINIEKEEDVCEANSEKEAGQCGSYHWW